MGRPKSKQSTLSRILILRVTPEQYAVLADHAQAKGTNITEIVRPQIVKVVDAIQTMKAA